jgi:hypothetical protein
MYIQYIRHVHIHKSYAAPAYDTRCLISMLYIYIEPTYLITHFWSDKYNIESETIKCVYTIRRELGQLRGNWSNYLIRHIFCLSKFSNLDCLYLNK